MGTEPLERKLAAILYADVAGYSRLTGEDEEGTHRALSAHLDAITDSIEKHNGKVLHFAGDAVLADFTTVSGALICAAAVQQDLEVRNKDIPEKRKVQFRIGVNLGEVIVDRGEIYGEGVNVAARLESLAEPGGICVSGTVYDAIGNKLPLDYEFMGEQSVKNIEKPVRAYHARIRPGVALPTPTATPKTKWSSRHLAVGAVVIVSLVVVTSVITWLTPWSKERIALPLPDKPSIAVLPFENMTGDPEQEYLSDGMTDDLITDLSKVSGLFVIARHSVFTYKGVAVKVQQVGKELGVRYVLEGSVRRAGGRIRINAQLIDASTGRHLWAERYDRDYQDIFAVQDEVIAQVVSAIAVKLTDTEQTRIARLPTDNLEAYDSYLRAEQGLYLSDTAGWRDTLSFYEKAIALDPEFADAYAGLARAAVEIWRLDYNDLLASAVARKRAYETAARALVLDPDNARAYSVLAVLQVVDGHHDAAIESAHKAVSASPSDADGYLNLGLVLAYSGRPTEARAAVESALRLNPKPAPGALLLAGVGFFADGQYERAVEAIEQARDARPTDESAGVYLASAYAHLGRTDEARAEVETMFETLPMANLAYFRARDAYYKREEDLATFIDGLRKAGLPEWPFGFRGNEDDRLDASALRTVTLGHTWMGRHANGVQFMQQISQTGVIAYRSRASFLTGAADVRGDMLCRQFEGYMLDRRLCGYVYRNPNGTRENHDEYVSVMPDALKYFSVVQ